jgi:hypothetical protein
MRRCDLTGSINPERLRGVRMPWTDVINAAGELAAAVGIQSSTRKGSPAWSWTTPRRRSDG